jgi:hypothetical protein
MNDLQKRLENLSPEKRALLLKKLNIENKSQGKLPSVVRRQDLKDFPLSFAQKRLWFLQQLDPASSFYNIPAAIRLTGSLNVKALRSTLRDILKRHEVLRSRSIIREGEPIQVIDPIEKFALYLVDLTAISGIEQQEMVQRLAMEESRLSFDLQQGPLFRAKLLHLGEYKHVLLMTMHHIVADGWSIGIFLVEFGEIYAAYMDHRAPALPDISIQYADYADWQIKILKTGLIEKQLSYWTEQLSEMPPVLELPTDMPRPAIQKYEGAHLLFQMNRDLSEAVRTFCKQQGVSLFMFFLAVFEILLHRYSQQADFGVGIPVANRQRSAVENLIGFFVNTLVMRSDFSRDKKFLDVLKSVRDSVLEAYDNQDLPFEKIVDNLQPQRNMSHSPLFQVLFDLQTQPFQSSQISDLTLELLEIERGTSKFDLSLTLEDDGEGITLIY